VVIVNSGEGVMSSPTSRPSAVANPVASLRQYAWTDSAEIKKYVRFNRARLSALSCREALKNVD